MIKHIQDTEFYVAFMLLIAAIVCVLYSARDKRLSEMTFNQNLQEEIKIKHLDMKDIISHKTALALKEAGFPQPEFGPGQFWYDEDGGVFVVGLNVSNGLRSLVHISWIYRPESKDAVTFAPSVTDLLRELPDRYNAAELLAAAWLEKNKKQ